MVAGYYLAHPVVRLPNNLGSTFFAISLSGLFQMEVSKPQVEVRTIQIADYPKYQAQHQLTERQLQKAVEFTAVESIRLTAHMQTAMAKVEVDLSYIGRN